MTFHGGLEFHIPTELWGFPGGSDGKKKKKKKSACNAEDLGSISGLG